MADNADFSRAITTADKNDIVTAGFGAFARGSFTSTIDVIAQTAVSLTGPGRLRHASIEAVDGAQAKRGRLVLDGVVVLDGVCAAAAGIQPPGPLFLLTGPTDGASSGWVLYNGTPAPLGWMDVEFQSSLLFEVYGGGAAGQTTTARWYVERGRTL